MRKLAKVATILSLFLLVVFRAEAIDHPGATLPLKSADRFVLVSEGAPLPLLVSETDDPAVLHAAKDLQEDFYRVT